MDMLETITKNLIRTHEELEAFYLAVGQRIREAREESKLTQAELGEKLNVSGQSIGHWESAERKIPLHMLMNISIELMTPFTWFIGLPADEGAIAVAKGIEDSLVRFAKLAQSLKEQAAEPEANLLSAVKRLSPEMLTPGTMVAKAPDIDTQKPALYFARVDLKPEDEDYVVVCKKEDVSVDDNLEATLKKETRIVRYKNTKKVSLIPNLGRMPGKNDDDVVIGMVTSVWRPIL